MDPYYLVSGAESNESLKNESLNVYREDDEYELLVKYRKLDRDSKKMVIGYLHGLMDALKKED